MHPTILTVTLRIMQRSQDTRQTYLASMQAQHKAGRSQRAGTCSRV